jgi:hypothetical protein
MACAAAAGGGDHDTPWRGAAYGACRRLRARLLQQHRTFSLSLSQMQMELEHDWCSVLFSPNHGNCNVFCNLFIFLLLVETIKEEESTSRAWIA